MTELQKVLTDIRIQHDEIMGDMAKKLDILYGLMSDIQLERKPLDDTLLHKLQVAYNLDDATMKRVIEARDNAIDNIRDRENDDTGLDTLQLFNAIPENLKWGESAIVDCPICHASKSVTVTRSEFNGHVWIHCKDCKRNLIQ